MFRYARHFARIFNRPLLIESAAFDAMLPGVERVFRAGVLTEPEAFVSVARERSERTGLRMHGSVAVIPIRGVLVHRGQYDAECNYLMGYSDIASMLDAALDDPECSSIVLDIDSPGGEVAGCFDLAAKIVEADWRKPVRAAVNDTACSAAYALASAARSISITGTGRVGSVGVLLRHESYEKYLEKLGVDVTLIAAGAHKTDGNPYESLTDEVRADLQTEVDRIYGLFVQLVAENRGLDEKEVRDMQARVYIGADSAGLADIVETPDALIERILSFDSEGVDPKSPQFSMEATMPIDSTITEALSLPADATEQDVVNTIKDRTAASYNAGRSDERDRIAGILGHENAEGRMDSARELALRTDLDPDAAGGVLATLPTSRNRADDQFAQMMTSIQQGQDVGADDAEPDSDAAVIRRILAA